MGTLQPGSCVEELGIEPMKVVAGAGHDTQCALAAVPTGEKDFIFISCGTWCLFGTELDEPIIDENSARFNITNEGGVGGKNFLPEEYYRSLADSGEPQAVDAGRKGNSASASWKSWLPKRSRSVL